MANHDTWDRRRWPNFRPSEFECSCCGQLYMDDDFMDGLQELRAVMGVPFTITSGYRCPEYNAQVSSTGAAGPHTTGKAADIQLNTSAQYRKLIAEADDFNGLGVNLKGDWSKRFIHLDDLEMRSWSYG